MTAEELIKYLQTLPSNTRMRVSVSTQAGWDVFSRFEDLNQDDYLDYLDGNNPVLLIGAC